jgi:hypothetical protein
VGCPASCRRSFSPSVLERDAAEDPWAFRARMHRIDLPRFGSQPERLGTDVKKCRRLSEVEPRFDTVCSRTINRDPIVRSKSGNTLTRPSIAVTGPQLVSVENARDEIVVGNKHQLTDGIDDVGCCGIALPRRRRGKRSSVWPPPIQWIRRTISAASASM